MSIEDTNTNQPVTEPQAAPRAKKSSLERNRKWREAHRPEVKTYKHEYYKAHPEIWVANYERAKARHAERVRLAAQSGTGGTSEVTTQNQNE